jgi:UbiD family decarboxylase
VLKWIIAVNEDIDITDIESIFWAVIWRAQPYHDIKIRPIEVG